MFWFQDYPRAGNPIGLLLAGALFIAAVVGLALFFGSFFRTRERAFQLVTVTVTSLPMLFFLSNLSWPMEATPRLLVRIAQLPPSAQGINAMVKLSQVGARLPEASADLANLAILALLYGALAMWRYRPGPDGAGPGDGRYLHVDDAALEHVADESRTDAASPNGHADEVVDP